ncbi:MAG: leucyl aminopeptidase [Promethearchaeota archaeon]
MTHFGKGEVEVHEGPLKSLEAPLLVVGVHEGGFDDPVVARVVGLAGHCLEVPVGADFTGRNGERVLAYPERAQGWQVERVALQGMGPLKLESNEWRKLGGHAFDVAKRLKLGVAHVLPPLGLLCSGSAATPATYPFQALVEGFFLARYRGWRRRGRRGEGDGIGGERGPRRLVVVAPGDLGVEVPAGIATSATRGMLVATAQNRSRELSDAPGNVATPARVGKFAVEVAKEGSLGLRARVLAGKELERERFHALLAVAAGSSPKYAPRVVLLEYQPEGAPDASKVALVGKGICFDTGGYQLKPRGQIERMKHDMSGAATVLSTALAAAVLRLPVRVVAVAPLTHNMIGGEAMLPGDVIDTRAGLTVEVLSTDAEGRLILADALNYAADLEPEAIVDVATLTGACRYALGEYAAGLFSNDDALADQLLAAGTLTHERLWRLPLWPEHVEAIKGKASDLKNKAVPAGDASFAAAFLSKFVGDRAWAHLDVAATAYHYPPRESLAPYLVPGSTGFGVRLLVEFLSEFGN